MTLDELFETLRGRFPDDWDLRIVAKERWDGSGSGQLFVGDQLRASWQKSLVGNPPIDGKTPRGPARYFDLIFFNQKP